MLDVRRVTVAAGDLLTTATAFPVTAATCEVAEYMNGRVVRLFTAWDRSSWKNVDRRIIQKLTRILASNPHIRTFKRLSDLGPLDNYRVTLNASVELDQRVYNKPTTSEVAGIWVEGNDNVTAYKRSIIVYGRSNYSIEIQPHFGCYDHLPYPLFFPNGESGWHPKIPRYGIAMDEIHSDNEDNDEGSEESTSKKGRNIVSMREYYCYKFQIRSNDNVILMGGRLFQQFAVDTYIKIETTRLVFVEKNQTKTRADLYEGVVDCFNAGEAQPSRVGQRVVLPASFIGGPRNMRQRFLDVMALVQDDGRHGIFLIMTCNPKWKEIDDELLPGQSAQDRPYLVARVFHAKLEDLKVQLFQRHIIDVVGSYVYVIEFQKRGLPHAHFLLIMTPGYKMNNPDDYDKLVCVEIPDPMRFPEMHDLVKSHMMHGPCGGLREKSPCMQGVPKICRFRYPSQFNEKTSQGEDSYPLYRRRNNGIEVTVRYTTLDNRWVAPYNPKLLMMFNCHINVETKKNIVINEIRKFQDARYVSPPEALWRVFSFPLSKIHPCVMALQIHLPNQQLVRFKDGDRMEDIVDREKGKNSMLTAFFNKNKEDSNARKYLYKDFPKHFTWNRRNHCWRTREHKSMIGRLVYANPAEGERYYLRLIFCHITGPTCFEDLYTANEASLFQFPSTLRWLFATMLIFCEPGNVRKLWDDHYDSLSEDYRKQYGCVERVQNMVLIDIRIFLESMSKKLSDYDLPNVSAHIDLQSRGYREVQEEYSINVENEDLLARDSLNPDHKFAYNEIMRHVDENILGVFFINGPCGTGKTFLYKTLLANIRVCGLIALATATSGVAANNMPGGRTAHSRFGIPLNLDLEKKKGAWEFQLKL
ncbi:unnamed protein product [Lactuca virosa]|uniref:ATP-dependent DNA helicase n=1 Tax=Lactuca virosa TaxID=75947 RepID=A0AAU9N1D1_9ASTR|nr:unnamed protein product [Lactuca virosa]